MALANNFEQTSTTTREFTLEFLEKITDNFSKEHIIGRGGYGIVYKGVLENGEEIALKKLHYIPGLDDTQFRNEFNNLVKAQHQNITRLVGYCYDLGHQRIKYGGEYIFAVVEQRFLCFEYLQGGSLDKHISDESCGLDWHTRFEIIKGVCEGLNYLHNGSNDPIYHLDLKPANILLDKNMIPKIGDFGLSRLFPSAQTYITTKIIGTPGYMPPEYIERYEITSKYDVFSLGVIIVRIMAGDEGYSNCTHMSSQEFLEHVQENWGKRLRGTTSSHTSEQVKTCIEIALRCVEVEREKRPTIAEIVNELNKVHTTEHSPTGQVINYRSKHVLRQDKNSEQRGRILFSASYRPPVPLDIFSCPLSPSSIEDELHLTDGVSYNYNGSPIPPAALKILLKAPTLVGERGITDVDVDASHVSGLIFVSERDDGLETLYIALRFSADNKVKVFALADIFGAADFSGARLEDSGCIGGGYKLGSCSVDHCLIYVSTKEPVQERRRRRSPWTVVYKTNLSTGKTERLTPKGVFDLSPAVSPSGKMVAVASFESKSWNGEIENLKTDIYVMSIESEEGQERKLLIENGGWPSWGSDNIIFFHRGTDKTLSSSKVGTSWSVFRYNITTNVTIRMTPYELDAVTPAAISETKVAVSTIRQKSKFCDVRVEVQYRHIEIFDTNALGLQPVQITQKMRPKCDHYNPFVLEGGARIGYHRCRSNLMKHEDHASQNLHKLESPVKDVGLFQVPGVFPTISKDGSKLAFVDNEFKTLWVADSKGLRIVYENDGPNKIFSPVWNQNPNKDTLYICTGTSFNDHKPLEIYAIRNASGPPRKLQTHRLTFGGLNNAFPSSNPEGDKLVFRSMRKSKKPTTGPPRRGQAGVPIDEEQEPKYKNLYIMMDAGKGELWQGWETQLTIGKWTDTHCQWSPDGDWIVFLSTRDKPKNAAKLGKDLLSTGDKPENAAKLGNDMDPWHFSVYLVRATDPTVVIRVMRNGGGLGGHINHPVFSPDGRSIAMMADLAAVSVDPMSLPMFGHTVRTYGDIFVVDINPSDSKKNKDVIKGIHRITHSRYECGAPAWTRAFAVTSLEAYTPSYPYVHRDGGESWHKTGHLWIPKRAC